MSIQKNSSDNYRCRLYQPWHLLRNRMRYATYTSIFGPQGIECLSGESDYTFIQQSNLLLRTTIDTELPGRVPGCGDPTLPGIPLVRTVAQPAQWDSLHDRENSSRAQIERMHHVIHN